MVKRWAGELMQDYFFTSSQLIEQAPNKSTGKVPGLRIWPREGMVQLATRTGLVSSLRHRILSAARLNRLSQVD